MQLDHIVHFVSGTPEELVETSNYAGIYGVLGGVHTQWGTANTLAFLASSYIEWLSLVDHSVAKEADHPLTKLFLYDRESGPGLGTICLRPDSIEEVHRRFADMGVATTDVLDASRTTPDGTVLRWKMLFVKEEPSNELPLPFFIEWEQSQQDKYADLEALKQLPPNVEELKVKRLVMGTTHPIETAKKWAHLLGVQSDENKLHLENTTIEFIETKGPHRLVRVDITGTGKDNTIKIEGGQYTLLP